MAGDTPLALRNVLRPCDDQVVARVVDGEAIMINLASGVYYSMKSTGAFMWERITAGQTLADVAAAVVRHYDVAPERAETDVLTLSAKLVEEQLVRIGETQTGTAAPRAEAAPAKLTYQTPQLEVFRDIGHLVALDPPMPGLKDLPWKGPTDA